MWQYELAVLDLGLRGVPWADQAQADTLGTRARTNTRELWRVDPDYGRLSALSGTYPYWARRQAPRTCLTAVAAFAGEAMAARSCLGRWEGREPRSLAREGRSFSVPIDGRGYGSSPLQPVAAPV